MNAEVIAGATREVSRSLPRRQPSAVRVLELDAPVVRHERILRMQGYSDLDRVRPAIAAAAVEMARRAEQLSRPSAAYRYWQVRALHADSVELSSGSRLHSRVFASRLAGCTEAVPFVLSCGMEIGELVIEMAESGDLLEAVLLETAGWLCIEDATRQLKATLQTETASRGCRITSRMGPGYTYRIGEEQADWPLQDQVELFRLLGDAELPVTLMSSSAMNPKLSRSGLYGVAPLHTHILQASRPGSLN